MGLLGQGISDRTSLPLFDFDFFSDATPSQDKELSPSDTARV